MRVLIFSWRSLFCSLYLPHLVSLVFCSHDFLSHVLHWNVVKMEGAILSHPPLIYKVSISIFAILILLGSSLILLCCRHRHVFFRTTCLSSLFQLWRILMWHFSQLFLPLGMDKGMCRYLTCLLFVSLTLVMTKSAVDKMFTVKHKQSYLFENHPTVHFDERFFSPSKQDFKLTFSTSLTL